MLEISTKNCQQFEIQLNPDVNQQNKKCQNPVTTNLRHPVAVAYRLSHSDGQYTKSNMLLSSSNIACTKHLVIVTLIVIADQIYVSISIPISAAFCQVRKGWDDRAEESGWVVCGWQNAGKWKSPTNG